MKTSRIRQHIAEYLADNPKSTYEIRDYINKRMKHGTSVHILTNILSKDSRFKKVGMINKQSTRDIPVIHDSEITIWALT